MREHVSRDWPETAISARVNMAPSLVTSKSMLQAAKRCHLIKSPTEFRDEPFTCGFMPLFGPSERLHQKDGRRMGRLALGKFPMPENKISAFSSVFVGV